MLAPTEDQPITHFPLRVSGYNYSRSHHRGITIYFNREDVVTCMCIAQRIILQIERGFCVFDRGIGGLPCHRRGPCLPQPTTTCSGMDKLDEILRELSHLNLKGYIEQKQQFASGFGGSCDVYTAWSTKHEKKVAIKQIRAFLVAELPFAKARGMKVTKMIY